MFLPTNLTMDEPVEVITVESKEVMDELIEDIVDPMDEQTEEQVMDERIEEPMVEQTEEQVMDERIDESIDKFVTEETTQEPIKVLTEQKSFNIYDYLKKMFKI